MRNAFIMSIIALCIVASTACNDTAPGGIADLPVFPEVDGGAGDGGEGKPPEGKPPEGKPPEGNEGEGAIPNLSGKPTFAVALSDYASAGVALIDGDGKVLSEKYISSGSAVPGLSAALHGDIALPTQPCTPGFLTVVARNGGDYLLQVDLATGRAVQLATQGPGVDASYSSNPYDIACLDGGQALVSRFQPNLTPNAVELDAGDDLLRVDLAKQKRLSRIDLSALRGKVGNDIAYARPGSLVRVGGFLLVGLSRLTTSFVADGGMLAIVDLEAESVRGFALPKLKNCGGLQPIPDRKDAVLISCQGTPYGDRDSSGILLASIDSQGNAKIEHSFQSKETDPVISSSPVSLGGTRALAVATGDYTKTPNTPDIAFVIDLETGEADELFMSTTAGEIGGGAFRRETGLLLVPDAGQGVRTFTVGDEVVAGVTLALDKALPPRGISPLIALD